MAASGDSKSASFLGHTSPAQAEIHGLLSERCGLRILVPREVITHFGQRVELWFEFQEVGKRVPCFIDVSSQPKCRREEQRELIDTRIAGSCLSHELYCLICVPQSQMD